MKDSTTEPRELLGHLYYGVDAEGFLTMMAWEYDDGCVPALVSTAMQRGDAVKRVTRFKDDDWSLPERRTAAEIGRSHHAG